jgi:TetR/AcrR family transcriptional regulator, transcriptional repressor for nem operon
MGDDDDHISWYQYVQREGERRSMPYSPEHRAQVREKIVSSARRLFNRRGFNAVSIDDVMAEAGLTRGSFYAYFDSKSDLYAHAITAILHEKPINNWDGVSIDPRAPDVAAGIIGDYLSVDHYEDIDGTCPLVALPNDVSRTEDSVKRAFENVLRALIDIFEQGLERKGEARTRALAIASLCVGGMVLARTVEDRALGDELRGAARNVALSLGRWGGKEDDEPLDLGDLDVSLSAT